MITEKLFKYLISLILIFTAYFTAIAQTSSAAPAGTVFHPNPVIGLVDGKPVTFEDVRNKKANDLSLQLYQHLSVQLMEYSLEKLAVKHKEIILTTEKKVNSKILLLFMNKMICRNEEPWNRSGRRLNSSWSSRLGVNIC